MVLCPEDERRIKGMMLTGWMSKADLLRGWAGQGKKKDQPASEAGEKKSGEELSFKHLKVKVKGQEMRISALFNRGTPDTLIGYGAAAILGLKGGQTRRLVTTEEGSPRMSYAWYDVPLQDESGRVWQVRANGVLRTARVKNEGKNVSKLKSIVSKLISIVSKLNSIVSKLKFLIVKTKKEMQIFFIML
jgi:hypothetical protein